MALKTTSLRAASRGAACVVIAAHAVLAVACGTERSAKGDRAAVASATAVGGGASPTKPACPKTGHWTPCQVKARLEQSGVAPRDSIVADLPRLGPSPAVYVVGTSALAVYLFADAAARERAGRTLDTLKYVAPSKALSVRQEATLIQNDNLIAVLYSQRDQQRERVSDAFLAGAPQP